MKTIPEEIERYRDRKWHREEALRIEKADDVEKLVEELGFCLSLTDRRTQLPSVYIAVCGRRDAFTPKNVQKDYECSLAWVLKDEVMMRGNLYYAKLIKGRSIFVAPRLIPYFNGIYGVKKSLEKEKLSPEARKILQILRVEWEMATSDLKIESGVNDRKILTKAIEELQKMMKVVPSEVLYKPKFTYIWTLAEGRFSDELSAKISRENSILELAKVFLKMQGMTLCGDLAKALGISRVDAGKANHQLVNEDFAERLERGVYLLKHVNFD